MALTNSVTLYNHAADRALANDVMATAATAQRDRAKIFVAAQCRRSRHRLLAPSARGGCVLPDTDELLQRRRRFADRHPDAGQLGETTAFAGTAAVAPTTRQPWAARAMLFGAWTAQRDARVEHPTMLPITRSRA